MHITIKDKTRKLSYYEKRGLSQFIVEKCRTRIQDVEWLKHVLIREDGYTDYLGYWTYRYIPIDNRRTHFKTVIVLNATYLDNVDEMKAVIAHEYGHNWTCGYLLIQGRIRDKYGERAPMLYYRIRRIDPKTFSGCYSKGWSKCDKEVLAEDYRCLFTPVKDNHRMQKSIGNPSSEVEDYLRRFGHPSSP